MSQTDRAEVDAALARLNITGGSPQIADGEWIIARPGSGTFGDLRLALAALREERERADYWEREFDKRPICEKCGGPMLWKDGCMICETDVLLKRAEQAERERDQLKQELENALHSGMNAVADAAALRRALEPLIEECDAHGFDPRMDIAHAVSAARVALAGTAGGAKK